MKYNKMDVVGTPKSSENKSGLFIHPRVSTWGPTRIFAPSPRSPNP